MKTTIEIDYKDYSDYLEALKFARKLMFNNASVSKPPNYTMSIHSEESKPTLARPVLPIIVLPIPKTDI